MVSKFENRPLQKSSPARAEGESSVLLRWNELPGLELLSGDFHQHAFLPHWHDSYMLASPAQGYERIRIGGTEHVIAPNTLLCLNPGELHDGEAADPGTGWHHRALYIPDELVRKYVPGARGTSALAFDHLTCAYGEGFLRLHECLQRASSQLERETLLADSLPGFFPDSSFAATAPSTERTSHHGLERVREYLHAHWCHACSLDELADLAGLSRYHLLRSFRRRFGLPPHAYQMQLRVQHAKDLLFLGRTPSQVALETGFYDQSHLTNTLRRYSGATPRRMLLAAQ